MGKLLLISFNLFIIMISKLYFGGDVSVVEQLPQHAKPGDSFEIKIEIEKGDREGFAKWQQSIPSGFTAKKGQTDGGTFSFKNQEVKVIWMALPQVEKFIVTYTLQSDPSLSGEYNFNGKFSYIEENERKEVIVEEETILISLTAPEIAEVIPTETNTPPADESTEQKIDPVDNTQTNIKETIAPETQTNTNSKQVLNNESVQINRSIVHMGEGFYEIDLEINKNDLESFGKIEEFIPPNYTASSIENKEGIFSFSKNVMKIMWMTLPEGETINLTYGLQSTSNELDSAVIFGVFSFLEIDESKQLKVEGSRFRNYLADEEDLLVDNSDDIDPERTTKSLTPIVDDIIDTGNLNIENSSDDITEVSAEDIIEDNTSSVVEEVNSRSDGLVTDLPIDQPDEDKVTEDLDVIEASSSNHEDLVESITNIPSPETSISYRVQIAASRREVQQQYFVERHNITEQVTIQPHEGWYKYTIGSYNIYKAARDKRNNVWGEDNKINDAFVTAYNEGVRISVQEALMVSKQKWYN